MLALVYASSVGAALFRPEGSSVATWWPAAGVAAALVVLGPPRWRLLLVVGVALTSGLGNLSAGREPMLALLLGLSNSSEAWVIAAFLRPRGSDRPQLRAPDDFFRLLAACGLGAASAGAAIGLSVAVTGDDWLEAFRTVTPSHLASSLVILPLALSWHQRPQLGRRLPELALQATLLGLALLFVFGNGRLLSLAFVPLPLLVWCGLRFGVLVTCVELLTCSAISTLSTARGAGPFDLGAGAQTIGVAGATTQVQVFVVCAALLTFPPCLAFGQRAMLLRRLEREQAVTTSTLETTAALIVMTDVHGTVLRTNATASRLTGFSTEQILGHPFWDTPVIPEERKETVRSMFASGDGADVVETREADVMQASGERLRVIWNNNLVRDADGEVVSVVCTGTDVTSQRSTTAMLQHLLEAPVATALVGLDARGRIAVVNQGAQELLHRSPEELMGRPVSEIVASTQPELYLEQARALADSAMPAQTGDWT